MTFYYTIYTDNWKCLIIGIVVVVDVTGRIHIPHIVSIARVRGTGYYGSYPILNTQSVNTIFLIFNFPPTGGYQLHRLFTTTLDWKNFLPFLLSIHEDKLSLAWPPADRRPLGGPFWQVFPTTLVISVICYTDNWYGELLVPDPGPISSSDIRERTGETPYASEA